MSRTIQLVVHDGDLHTRLEDIKDPLQRKWHTQDVLMVSHYDAGDCDTIAWPEYDAENLRSALYNAREMGLIPFVHSVLLPDGKEFAIFA